MIHQAVGDGDGDALQTHAPRIDDFEPLGPEPGGIEAQVEGPLGGGRCQGCATFGYQQAYALRRAKSRNQGETDGQKNDGENPGQGQRRGRETPGHGRRWRRTEHFPGGRARGSHEVFGFT